MNLSTHTGAVLHGLTLDLLRKMPPAARQRLADEIERVRNLLQEAERQASADRAPAGPQEPKVEGVLALLKAGHRAP